MSNLVQTARKGRFGPFFFLFFSFIINHVHAWFEYIHILQNIRPTLSSMFITCTCIYILSIRNNQMAPLLISQYYNQDTFWPFWIIYSEYQYVIYIYILQTSKLSLNLINDQSFPPDMWLKVTCMPKFIYLLSTTHQNWHNQE